MKGTADGISVDWILGDFESILIGEDNGCSVVWLGVNWIGVSIFKGWKLGICDIKEDSIFDGLDKGCSVGVDIGKSLCIMIS